MLLAEIQRRDTTGGCHLEIQGPPRESRATRSLLLPSLTVAWLPAASSGSGEKEEDTGRGGDTRVWSPPESPWSGATRGPDGSGLGLTSCLHVCFPWKESPSVSALVD
jgi:hypothetical protein